MKIELKVLTRNAKYLQNENDTLVGWPWHMKYSGVKTGFSEPQQRKKICGVTFRNKIYLGLFFWNNVSYIPRMYM